MAIPARHGEEGRYGNGSLSVASGHIEGTAWDIERLGLSHRLVVEGGNFTVSTPKGHEQLRHLILCLSDLEG